MEKGAPKWDRHSILAEFRRRGIRLADFAEQHGRNAKSFSAVWTRWNRIDEQLIAGFLGDPVEVVWPDRYPVASSRLFNTSEKRAKTSQNGGMPADMGAAA